MGESCSYAQEDLAAGRQHLQFYKLVCPNVSFMVVTESILFRLVNLCSSYGATVGSCSRFFVNGKT